MKRVLSLLMVAASLASAHSFAHADWPQWRGPARTGFVPSGPLVRSLPQDGLSAVWQIDGMPGGNSGGWSSPVIAGGRVYLYAHTKSKNPQAENLGPAKYPWLSPEQRTMSDAEYEEYEIKRRAEGERRAKAFRFDERLLCLDLDSGELIWERQEPSTYSRFTQSGTPCVAGGRVFLLAAGRVAKCYDAETGQTVWTRQLPGEFRDEYFSSSFAVRGDHALVCCGPLTALRVSDGEIAWQGDEPLDFQSHSSPVIWDGGGDPIAIVNASGGNTKAYRMADGHKLWELETGVGRSTPIVAEDTLLTYGGSRKSGLAAFRLDSQAPGETPQLRWRFQRVADSGSTPVVRGPWVFVQGDKRLAKVKLADGDAQWQTTLKISNPRYTSPIAAGDQLFYAWEGLLVVDAESDRYQSLYDAKVDSDGRLIATQSLRTQLESELLQDGEQGLAKIEQAWQQRAIKTGPLACSSPAISDGRIVIRLRDGWVCYDLRERGL